MRRAAPERARVAGALLGAWLAAGPGALAVAAPSQAEDPANDPRVRAVASKLTCYCGCNTQSIADCSCGVAREERAAIRADLDGGAGADEILAAWVDRYGPRILIEPPRRGFNLLGWFLPGLALIVTGVLLALTLRRWARSRPATASDAPAPPPDPRYLERLQRELRNLEP